MATAAQMRKLALSLPETEEKSHFEHPDFRVGGKIFAGLSIDGERGTLKLTPEIQSMVLEQSSGAFTPAAGAWGRSGWTYVDLARVEIGALEELLGESWRLVAPKRVVAAREASLRREAPKPKARAKKRAPRKGSSRPE
jgi:hypothetical protein